MLLQVVNVLGLKLPFYKSPTLLLSIGLSIRVLYHLIVMRPDVIHVSCPGVIVFAAVLYSRILGLPLVVSYHTHVPYYIPRYTWSGLVAPMWSIIRWCTRRADLTLVTSKVMQVGLPPSLFLQNPTLLLPLPLSSHCRDMSAFSHLHLLVRNTGGADRAEVRGKHSCVAARCGH